VDPRVLAAGDPEAVTGAALGRAWRRAKYLLLEAGEHVVVIHLRMTGKLTPAPASGARVRARLRFDHGPAVAFVDARRLGELWVLPADALAAFLAGKRLGEEPWPQARDGGWWRARLAGLSGPIKPALLRQDRVAGLGNIAASEILWRAGVDPWARVPALTPAAWPRIAAGAREHLALALADAAREDFVYLTESRGASNPFEVYGRVGRPCPRCGGVIERGVQSGRATFWCRGCQR